MARPQRTGLLKNAATPRWGGGGRATHVRGLLRQRVRAVSDARARGGCPWWRAGAPARKPRLSDNRRPWRRAYVQMLLCPRVLFHSESTRRQGQGVRTRGATAASLKKIREKGTHDARDMYPPAPLHRESTQLSVQYGHPPPIQRPSHYNWSLAASAARTALISTAWRYWVCTLLHSFTR